MPGAFTNEYGRPTIGSRDPGGAGSAEAGELPGDEREPSASTASDSSPGVQCRVRDTCLPPRLPWRGEPGSIARMASMVARSTRRAPSGIARLRPPSPADAGAFLAAVQASRTLHGAWVRPALDARALPHLAGQARAPGPRARNASFLACRDGDDSLVGTFNFSEIVRGAFRSAYLGYYGFAPHAGAGLHDASVGAGARRRVARPRAAPRRGERPADQHALARAGASASASRAKATRAAT